jgi:hypothetical protein
MSSATISPSSVHKTKQTVYKDFTELSLALWRDSGLTDLVLHESESYPVAPRHYNIIQASRYLGKTEAALRLFLWENGLSHDAGEPEHPLFSEQFLDLISNYGYLFDYSKIWRKTGHHEQADNLRREAELIFGLSSKTERESYFLSQPQTSDAKPFPLEGNLEVPTHSDR